LKTSIDRSSLSGIGIKFLTYPQAVKLTFRLGCQYFETFVYSNCN